MTEPSSHLLREIANTERLVTEEARTALEGLEASRAVIVSAEEQVAANALAHSWISQSLLDMFDGEPEIVVGDILYSGGIIPRTHPAKEP
jgi:hypothetical protein